MNCSYIANCNACYSTNNSIICQTCNYPYYISNNKCIKGSSLLCQNGSIGYTYT